MIEINAIKIKNGYYISDAEQRGRYKSEFRYRNYLFNGMKPEKTYDSEWCYVPDHITSIQDKVYGKYVNKRFELIDPEMVSDHIPLTLPYSEVVECCDYECEWKEEFKHLQSLYEFKQEKEKDSWVEVEFVFNVIMEINDIEHDKHSFNYDAKPRNWMNKNDVKIDANNIKHQWIDKIVFPSVLLQHKPSKLSSHESYRIIRKHVTDNIDPKVAKITSDYDFCFEVSKRIKKRYGGSGKEKHVTIFEMTYSPENYKGYTPIKGFQGESHEDLKNKIDEYLNNLMERINEPLIECPHCSGLGVINENLLKG